MIPYGRQTLDEDDVSAVVGVLRGDWLTQGPAVEEFERALADAVGAPHAVAFSSGTAALHAACAASGLGPGDELVTSAITFAASANCGAYVGAVPRFADIDPATWNAPVESLAGAMGERTKVVVPVHFTGLPVPMAGARAAFGDGTTIIEDASHALGALDGGEPVGSCANSDMAVFSFHPVKSIAAGEGGMVTTRDPRVRDALLAFRNHGFAPRRSDEVGEPWLRSQETLGFNYRLSDIHSALGRSQLRKLDAFITRRNEVADRYRELLSGVEEVELPARAPEGSRHAQHLFVVRCRAGREARHELYDRLRERGIATQVHYAPVYHHPWYREQYGHEPGLCPEAEAYYDQCLSLPCYASLTESDQVLVAESVRELAAA